MSIVDPKSPIFLVGYMGAGKSTVGRKLATLLKRTFIDTDIFIENRFRKRISDMFSEEGELVFRRREQMALEELLGYPNAVIATGGGLPCFHNHMTLINQTGISIYLRHTVEAIVQRLSLCKRTRPTVRDLEGEAFEKYVRESLAEREPYYSQSRLVIDYAVVSPEGNEYHIAEYIVSLLEDPLLSAGVV